MYTYGEHSGWEGLNLLSTIGAVVVFISMAVFMINVIVSWRRGARAPDNPWKAAGLEWATTSPPPDYNFAEIPAVNSRTPLWEPDFPTARVKGLPESLPTVLVTRLHDAEPEHVSVMPEPSIWPLLAALATTGMFISTVFTPWGLVWGSIPIAITLIAWFWPRREYTQKVRDIEIKPEASS
jgi:hypothetical protein